MLVHGDSFRGFRASGTTRLSSHSRASPSFCFPRLRLVLLFSAKKHDVFVAAYLGERSIVWKVLFSTEARDENEMYEYSELGRSNINLEAEFLFQSQTTHDVSHTTVQIEY